MTRQQKKNLLTTLNTIILVCSLISGSASAIQSGLKLGDAVKHLPKKGEK